MNPRCALLAVAFMAWFAFGVDVGCAAGTRASYKGIAFPIRLHPDHGAVAQVTIDRVYPSSQRRGFFRIAILPLVIAEGVTITCTDPAQLAEALAAAGKVFPGVCGRKEIELRRLSIQFYGEPSPRLQAGLLHFTTAQEWHLSDGVTWHQPGKPWAQSATAVLKVTGVDGGAMYYRTGTNTVRFDLLGDFRPSASHDGPPNP